MVARISTYIYVLWILLIPFGIGAQQIRMFAELDRDPQENAPIMGTVQIEHPNTATIDKASFRLKNAPLATEQIKEVKYSPTDPLTLTIFRFQLPPQPKGLYLLDEISAKVGGKTYQTTPISYEVKKRKPTLQQQPQAASSPKPKDGKPLLILEAFVEPSAVLYVGQRTKVGYRYYFDHSIDATKEVLPLLEAEGFKKIGGKITRTAQDDSMSLLEVAQEVEAIKVGEFSFGPSYYEGYPQDAAGQRMEPQIKAEAPIIKISVVELPQNVVPASYKKAIGHYTFETKLITPASVEVGEKMLLRISIQGTPLEGIDMPDLCCQPGMAGRFHFSDIPPAPKLQDKSLQFDVEIRPIDAEIKEIPELEFSFFNPDKKIYEKVYSKPIPIDVKAIAPEEEAKQAAESFPKMDTNPQPIPIASVKEITIPFIITAFLLSWWGLLMIPVAIGIVYFQYNLKNAIAEYRLRQQTMTSKQLLDWLPSCANNDLAAKIKECLMLKLVETGVISELCPYEQLSDQGSQGKVKQFLRDVDSWHYAQMKLAPEALIKQTYSLYNELSGSS